MKIISDETKTKILNITEGIFAISFYLLILLAIYASFRNDILLNKVYGYGYYIASIMLVSGIIYFPMNYFWRLNK